MLNALEREMLAALKAAMGFKTDGLDLVSFCDAADAVNSKIRAAIKKAEAAAVDHPQGAAIRKLATELWDDDECTVDGDATIAAVEEDGAAWVQVWQRMDADVLRENGIETEGMEPASLFGKIEGQDRESYSDEQDRESYSG
jgi:hypothetical protein